MIALGTKARDHINAHILVKRLRDFALIDPDNPKPGDVRMTRTQAMVALSLLRKVLPDLAAVEVSGNPDKPLSIQLVRFSDGVVIDQPANPIKTLADLSNSIPRENVDGADTVSDNNEIAEGAADLGPQRDQNA